MLCLAGRMENEAEGARVVGEKKLLNSIDGSLGCGDKAWKIEEM